MDSSKDKIAFISGGASGIGFAIATLLAEQGAIMVIAERTKNWDQKPQPSYMGQEISCIWTRRMRKVWKMQSHSPGKSQARLTLQ
jgi:enoyl-[acyl-carrier-protein] reductase (NADH)